MSVNTVFIFDKNDRGRQAGCHEKGRDSEPQERLTAVFVGGIFQYRGSERSFRNSVKHIIPVGEEQIAELYDVA